MNVVDVTSLDFPEQSWFPMVAKFVNRLLHQLEIQDWEISVVFCSSTKIQELNRNFRQKDYPTDVLSFSQDFDLDLDNPVHYAGDIVVSLELAQENCKEFDVSLEEELKRLLIHGVLHLYGMNHLTNDDSEPMLLRQEELLNKISGDIQFEI